MVEFLLKPVEMRKVTVILSKSKLTVFLAYAGQRGLLHLVSVPEKQIPTGATPFETGQIIGRTAAIKNRLSSIGPNLGEARSSPSTPDPLIPPLGSKTVEELTEFLDKETLGLEQQVRQLESRSEALDTEEARHEQLSRLLLGLEKLGVRLNAFGGTGFTIVLVGESARDSIDTIRTELDKITYGNAIFAIAGSEEKTDTFFAIVPTAFQDEARQSLATLGARLEPALSDLPPDPSAARKQVDQKLEEILVDKRLLEDERERLSKETSSKYASLTLLTELLDIRAKALSTALSTQSTVLLQAWVPDSRVTSFTKGAHEACGDDISIQVDEHARERMIQRAHEHSKELIPELIVEQEPPPTLLDVSPWFAPLQSVVNNFGIPAYHELNPLPFMIITYPIIYGLMFGDVGQGLLFIFGGLFLWNLKRRGRRIFELGQLIADGAELLILLGIGIVVFGIVFGDFFGFEPDFLKLGMANGERIPLFSPSELKVEFMVITLFVGVAHLTFGLVLSTINKVRNKEYAHAIFGPVSWMVFYLSSVYLISQVVLAGFKFGVVEKPPLVFVLIPVVAPLILMAWKEGGLHMFEAFLSSASNTLSYLRIWALNIADFEFKFALFTAGGILGAVLGNFLVLIIEGLIVFVQTLRLHWVEWFSKFYEGTGTRFAPYQEPSAIGLVATSKWSNQ